MRVIAGKCRSMPLRTPSGKDTRPTTDRIKETLFNILMPEIPGCRFLDLFAGSGGIGIEALSRGASYCCFVDAGREAADVIRKNLAFTKLGDAAEVLQMDAAAAILRLRTKEPFDVVFLDPPYEKGLEKHVMELLLDASCIDEHTLLVFETSLTSDCTDLEAIGYRLHREKRYKTNRHLFFQKRSK